jgi:hypothetical protein
MHHMIVGSPLRGKGLMIDHINGNGLDNRKENLRIVNYRGNALNRIDQKGRFPGTIFNPKTKKWQAKIKVNGHNKHLGYFDTAKMAFSAYLRELKKSDRENYDQYMAFTKLKEELRK